MVAGARASQKVIALSFKKKISINARLCLPRDFHAVWLIGWTWRTGGEQREGVMKHIPNTLPEKEYPS